MRMNRRGANGARRRGWPTLLLTIVLTAILASCGGGSAPTATTAPASSAPSAPASTATGGIPGNPPTPTRAAASTAPTPTAARTSTAAAGPSTQAITTAFPAHVAGLDYGMNVWLPTADQDRTLDLLTGAGFGWARQWISWESVEPAQGSYSWDTLDKLVASAQKHNVKLMLILLRAPQWASPNGGIPKDKQLYAKFVTAVATRYKGKIAAYEVWNEANLAGETGGTVNAGEYVELLKAAFPAIKAADPNAIVVYGGLTPTGENNPALAIDDAVYLKQSYAYNNGEVKQYFDVLGVHAAGTLNPPDTLFPDKPGPGPGFFDNRSFYFRRAEDLRKVMEDAGDGQKQVWITEFGWTTKNAAKGYEYGQYVSEDQQAQYLVAAYDWAKQHWPWVGVMFLWNLNFSTVSAPTDEKTPWSIINADYTPRPAYDALKKMPKK
jgi:hypothetical protein